MPYSLNVFVKIRKQREIRHSIINMKMPRVRVHHMFGKKKYFHSKKNFVYLSLVALTYMLINYMTS